MIEMRLTQGLLVYLWCFRIHSIDKKNSSSVLSQWSQIKKTKGWRPLCSCSGKTEAEPEGTFFVAKVYMHSKTNINFNMPCQVLSKQISSVNQIKRQDKYHDIHGHIKINCNDLGL